MEALLKDSSKCKMMRKRWSRPLLTSTQLTATELEFAQSLEESMLILGAQLKADKRI